MKSSKLKSAEIIKEVRKEKALVLAEMQADSTTFDPVNLNRKIKPDSKYREALTVQSNIETARILANIANNKLEEYNNPDKLIDDIEIDKIIDNYENLVDYKEKFTNFDEYLDYLDKLSNEGDEDLNLVINTIYDELIEESLVKKEELNPKLLAKVQDKDLLKFNKDNLAVDPNAKYNSVVSTPINNKDSNIYLTGKKDIATGLLLQDKKNNRVLVLGKDKSGVKILRNNKTETVSEDSLNNTTRLGSYRTADVNNTKYIVTPKALINVADGSIKTDFDNLTDAIQFRRATLGIFSTSTIAKIEEDRKKELRDSDLRIRDAEKLYPSGDLVIISKDEKVTIHKKTLGVNPSTLKDGELYSFKFIKEGKEIDRVFRYYASQGLVKQVKTKGTLIDDPNYQRINDKENYLAYQELSYFDKQERNFKNISLINKKYDEKYVEEVANGNISIESALQLLSKFNTNPHKAVMKALEDKIDLNENYDIRTELNKNLKDIDANVKTVNTLLLERGILNAKILEELESLTPEELEKEFKDIISNDYEPILIPEGKAIPITLNDGSKLQLTGNTGVAFLRNKKTNKIKLSVLSFENTDDELIRLSVAQAFVEKVLDIPVYDASVIKMSETSIDEIDVSLLSIFTYDNTKMPYNSGFDYINSNTELSDKDSKIEKIKNQYETLNNYIKDLIDKGQTTVEQLASKIKEGLGMIPKNGDANLVNERNKFNEQYNLLTSNSNVKDLVVVNKNDLTKAKQISLDFTGTTESQLKNKYKGKFIYATPGSGKTTIARELEDVIDTDDLMLDVMSELHSEFVRRDNESTQDFILRYVIEYQNKNEVDNIVLNRVEQLLAEGKTVLTGTRTFLTKVNYAFSIDNENVRNRLKDKLEGFKLDEALNDSVEINDLRNELLDKTTKSKEKTAKVKETDINRNSFFTMNGKVNKHAGFNILIGKQEIPANVDSNNNVTLNDGKLPKKNNIVKILNQYNEIDIDDYDSRPPLTLNNELKGSVIYMDEVTMDLFFKGNKEDNEVVDIENIKASLNAIGVYFYDDILMANGDMTDSAVKEILAKNQAVIKVLNTKSPELINGVKSNTFRVEPKTLLDFTLDKYGISSIADAQPYVKQVNDFTTSLKDVLSNTVSNYTDLVGQLFTVTPFTEVLESFSRLSVLLNTKLQNYINNYEKYTLEPILDNIKDTGDGVFIEEEDTYMQSDLYDTKSLDPYQAYPTYADEVKVSEEAKNWLTLFNNIKGTNYTIEELDKLYFSAKVNSAVEYLYIDENTVIGYIKINGEDVPIGLLDTIERVKEKKIRYGTEAIIPAYLQNLWSNIKEQILTRGANVISDKQFVVNDIHYNGLHKKATTIGELRKHRKFSDLSVIKLRKGETPTVFFGKDKSTSDITNYEAIMSGLKNNASHWYITVKVADNKYRLYPITIKDLSHDENSIKANINNIKNNKKYVLDNFLYADKIQKFVDKMKDDTDFEGQLLNFMNFDSNKLKNILNKDKGLWSNPANVNNINVNIGTQGFLNTNFIINSKERVAIKPTVRRKPPPVKRFSRAKGLVTRKLSRENALNNLKRILPEGYDVRFYENLIKEGNDYLWGYVSQNVIGLSDQGRIGEEYHEAFHVVFNAFINQTERERLLGHIKNYYKSRIDNNYTEEQLNDPDFAEELLADLYRDFALAYDEQGNKSIISWIKDIPSAIIRFFKRLFNLETSIQRDKQKLDKFFKSISVGTFSNRNKELINSFKTSKAVSSIYKNGTEKQQIVNMLSGLAAQMNVYDLAKPETIINDSFLKPEESILTNIENPKSLVNVFISELNRKLQLSEDDGGFIMNEEKLDVIRRVVNGLRFDLDVNYIDNVLTITKLEGGLPKFGEIPSSIMASFAEHGYMISDIDIENVSEIEFDDSIDNELEQAIEEGVDISEEEANQKENYQIKNYINPPHLKIRGVAKSFLSLIRKDEVDMFGFNINFNYSPQEAANKFLLAFGNTDDPIKLKEKIFSRNETELNKPEEFRDSFYVDLYDLIEEHEVMDKTKVYNSLWDTLGKLAKADFYNIVVTQVGENVKFTRTMANLDDLKYKIKNKLFNIVDIQEKYAEQRNNLPSNANLVIQFINTINTEELNAAESFDNLSTTNKKAIVALMNYIGYNDSFENENYTSIFSLDFKNDLIPFIKLAKTINRTNVAVEVYKNRTLRDTISSKLPSDISSTHKTVDGKLYYEWQVPNAVNRIVKELNKPSDEREQVLDRLYEDLPLMESGYQFKYEESNGTIDKLGDTTKEVSNYTAKDLLTEIIMSAQDGSFITPVLSDSGRQVYIGGINFLTYDDALDSLVKLALIENNRRLTEGDINIKNYNKNQNNFYTFSTIDPKFFPTVITDFKDFKSNNYIDLKNEVEKVINQRVEDFTKTLAKEYIYLDDSMMTNSSLKSLKNVDDRTKTLYANHILNHIQLTYILLGDPAYYKNYEDLVKRAKQMISPSSISNIYNTFDIEVSYRNYYDTNHGDDKIARIAVSENMRVSIKEDIERKSLNDEQLKALGLEKEYKKNNLTDAQSYIDDIAYRDRLIAEGTWTQVHQDYMDMSMNGFPASKLTIEKALRTGKSIEDIKKQSPVEVIKPFYYSIINYIKNGRSYSVPFQKKDSEFKISPFYGLKTINGIENSMYNSYYYKLLTEEFGYTIEQEVVVDGKLIPHRIGFNRDNRKADVVSFESAIKVFTDKEHIQNIDKPFDKTKVMTVPFKYWGRQMETPKGHFNKDVSLGTQIRKLITSRLTGKDIKIKRQDGSENTPNELLKEYNQLLIEDIKRGEKRFRKSIETNGAIDGKKILNLIKAEFLSRKKPLQYLEALELLNSGASYDELVTRIPISHPFHTLQIQTILNSLHRNKVTKLKFKNGFKLANASSIGFKTQPKIVFNNPANPKEGIKHFEVYAPIHDTRLYEFVDEGSGLIPESRMSEIEAKYPGILDGVVYRIPTEEKYSMYKTKIIGFVVDEVGAIFMPDVATTRSGLDFDIDKMFGFFKDGVVTEIDGKKYTGLTPKQYAKKSKYAIDTTEFNDDYNDYQAQVISDNAKLDIMMDVLSSEHTTISQMKPGGFSEMENHALELEYISILKEGHVNSLGVKVPYKYEEFKVEIDNFKLLDTSEKREIVKSKKDFWDIVNISNTINRMNLGKQVLGLAANYNAMSAVVENEIIREKPPEVIIKVGEKETKHTITYNTNTLSSIPTSLFDLDNNLKYENTSMLVAASADNGKTPTLEPLGLDLKSFNLYMALTGFGFPRRMIEKLLAIQKIPNLMKNIPTPKLEELDMDITENKLESILFNHENPDVKAIVYTVNQLINSKRTKAIGSSMSQLLKYVKIGDNGLQSNTFDNMMTLLDYNNYVEDLDKKKKADYSIIINSPELFNNESTRKMFSGLDIITDVAKIPKEFGVILKEYKIKPEYYLDFYSAVYAYVTRNEYKAFMSPQQVTDPKLKDKKIQSILNVVNHLKDFKESFPDNLFLKQLSLNDTNKVIFTEQRKKDDSLINTTMNDFENLLNSDEVVEVKDKYDGRFVTIKVSDFANDLAYYSIQSYGFGYNYESFSYIIPPAYYDNHVEYVSTVDNKIKDYINNPTMFNNIFIEYALNNPRNIDLVESTPVVVNLSAMIDELSNFGSFAYQPVDIDKKQFNNVFLFNNKSIMAVNNTLFTELIYRVGKEHIVKIFEKNDKSYYIIANVNKQDNIDYKALNNSLDTTIKLHYPTENNSKQNKLKDYGLFTQEFYLKSFNKEGIKFEPKEVKEITEKGTDTPELTTVLNTEVLSITNISEGKSEIIKLLSDISKTTASSIEDVINGNFKYDNRFLNNFTNITFDKTNNKITITERNYLENEEQQSLSEVIPMLKEVLNDYNKNKQVEVETPIQQIYSQLGNKTQSENVVIKSWNELKDATKAITPQGIVSTRIKNTTAHFGNPFTPDTRLQNLIQVKSTKEAVERYIDWVITGKTNEYVFIGIQPEKLEEQREWILEQLKSGKLKELPILYYTKLGEPSHATALDYLINKYDWNKQSEVNIPQDKTVTYTPIGKTQQTYTIVGGKIFNKDGVEVFKEDSRDRNKIFANLAIKEKRAVIVTWKDNNYVVNNNNKIISVKTGDMMKWGPENGDYKGVIAEANKLFKLQQPESQTEIKPITNINFQGYKGGFDNTGKGTPRGDGKDKAMREIADGFIGEILELSEDSSYWDDNKDYKPQTSSAYSVMSIAEKNDYPLDDVDGITVKALPNYHFDNKVTYFIKDEEEEGVFNESSRDAVIMLARNSEYKGKPLTQQTKNSILDNHKKGTEFVVGDMPGVDSQFIDYLQEIGAKFTIYHTGDTPRIKVNETTNTNEFDKGSGFEDKDNCKTR